LSAPLLQVAALGHSFGGLRAVNDVSFDLGPGEVVALMGPNGAGKTTLLNLISGQRQPDSGRVLFADQDVTEASPSSPARKGMLRSYQNGGIFAKLTATENVAVPLLARGIPLGQARERSRDVLVQLGLAPVLDDRAELLSGGQRKLIDFARCVANRVRLVLLDEPTNGVHPHLGETMAAQIGRMRDEGTAFLIVSHDLPWAFSICTRAVMMAAGEVLVAGRPADVAADSRVHEAYL